MVRISRIRNKEESFVPDIHTIGVLTGGGDCPGLNAVIRGVVRTALGKGMTVKGIQNGFQGLVEDMIVTLHDKDVAGILPRGGTILGTTNRDNPFHYKVEENGKYVFRNMSDRIVQNLKNNGIQALVLIENRLRTQIYRQRYSLHRENFWL